MDLIPQARGDVNRLTFGCPSTIVIVVTVGEANWPSLNRTGGSSVYHKFSSPACHIQGDPSPHWRKEDESRRIWSQVGSWAPSVSMQMFARNWGCLRLPL